MSITALTYLAVYFLGLVRCISGYPIFGLYAYFFSFYMHAPGRWWGHQIPSLRWSLIAGIVTLLVILYKNKNVKFWVYTENKLLTLFSILVIFQWSWALSPSLQVEYIILIVKFLILIFIIQNIVLTVEDVEKILIVNLLGSAYISYIGITTHVRGRFEGVGTAGMDDANLLSMHLAAVLVFSGFYLLKLSGIKFILSSIAISIVLYAVFLTESRGVIIALAVTGLFSLRLIPIGNKKKFITLFMLGIFAASLLLGPQLVKRLKGLTYNEEGQMQEKSAASRIVIIKSQYEMFKEKPFFGHGHRGTLLLSPYYIPKEYMLGNKGFKASHNVFMAMLVDHGIIGCGLYFTVIILCIRKAAKVRKIVGKYANKLADEINLLTSLSLSLLLFIVAGMGSNNKKLEFDIWMIALIPVVYGWIIEKYKLLKSMDEGKENIKI